MFLLQPISDIYPYPYLPFFFYPIFSNLPISDILKFAISIQHDIRYFKNMKYISVNMNIYQYPIYQKTDMPSLVKSVQCHSIITCMLIKNLSFPAKALNNCCVWHDRILFLITVILWAFDSPRKLISNIAIKNVHQKTTSNYTMFSVQIFSTFCQND